MSRMIATRATDKRCMELPTCSLEQRSEALEQIMSLSRSGSRPRPRSTLLSTFLLLFLALLSSSRLGSPMRKPISSRGNEEKRGQSDGTPLTSLLPQRRV
ncbi:hypothetical protein B0H14DRAFT_3474744 [Mycena olivaceomarginata]|nr:hypothetical protein B0H14DRAFT_3474744 [Mycena olivaceomarginata]